MLKIHTIYGADADSNIFVLEDSGSGEALLVDAGTGSHSVRVQKMIEKFVPLSTVKQIVITHKHYDHTGGAAEIVRRTGAGIFMHKLDSPAIEQGDDETAAFFYGKQEPVKISRRLEGGETIHVGKSKLEVIHTPGHTKGCICLYHAESKSLISGDTVFADGALGRWDLPSGNREDMAKSIKRLCLLDVENLYPGHGYVVEGGAGEHIQMALESL